MHAIIFAINYAYNLFLSRIDLQHFLQEINGRSLALVGHLHTSCFLS